MKPDDENINSSQIEIRSEEVQELLGKVPEWILRWGITIITLIIFILITGSALFRYPDIQHAEIILTTETPPADLVAKINGKIQNLFVKDNQPVKEGDFIALLETAADYKDISEVEKILGDLKAQSKSTLVYEFERKFDLGELQTVFAAYAKNHQDYKNFIKLDYHQKKIQALRQELKKHDDYFHRLEEQSSVQKKELALAHKQFSRDSLLFRQSVIASSDYEKSESSLLKSEFSSKETETSLANARIQVSKLNQQILDLELEYNKELKEKEIQVTESLDKLMAEIEIWKQKYLLISPIDGKVSFTKFWSENQQVTENEIVMTVIPENPGRIIGKINLSVDGAGKVKPGQMVNIKFANYPFMEYGMVRGKVAAISQIPNKNYYSVEVNLTDKLLTNYGKRIEFRQEMPGKAEIITENLSLLKRIINPVKAVIKRQQMNE